MKNLSLFSIIFLLIVSCSTGSKTKLKLGKYDGPLYFETFDEQKYPRDTIKRGPNDSLSLFNNKWYSEHLNSLKEPILKKSYSNYIRYTNLGTWEKPFTYRIENENGKITFNYKSTNGLGGYYTGKLIKHLKKDLSLKKWNVILQKINEIDFWNIPTQDPKIINDGAEWILEVSINGKYHLVTRNSPNFYDDKKYAELCELISNL